MTVGADPLDLATAARDLLRDDAHAAHVWPRAAAVLARQSIELAMDHVWQLRAPEMRWASQRCQLLCLGAFLGDETLAERTGAAWGALSHVLHHHPYELAPTHAELLGWIDTAWDLGNHVERVVRLTAPAVTAPFT